MPLKRVASPSDAERVLNKAVHEKPLTEEELEQVRSFLNTVKTLGKIGKFLLWLIVTAALVSTAIKDLKAQWF